jgi:hypothetical protein
MRLTEESLEELRPGLVETREWFVEKKNRGIVQESARDGQSLLHAAGIVAHRFISAPRQADALDLELEIGAAAGQTQESGVKLKILYSGQITIERCVMGQVSDQAPGRHRRLARSSVDQNRT